MRASGERSTWQRMNDKNDGLSLTGLDGSNPLGFLAALGVVAVLDACGAHRARLTWSCAGSWHPVVKFDEMISREDLSSLLFAGLRGRELDSSASEKRKLAEQSYVIAIRKLKQKRDEISKRRLRGSDRTEALNREVAPLESDADVKRAQWRAALVDAVPSPELALGKHLSVTAQEFRKAAGEAAETASARNRACVDLVAHFASDACYDPKTLKVEATPFCFITGSGHQYFLDTVGALMQRIDPTRIQKVLFEPWRYDDEKLSMRWDPIEDRRYALMWSDPTSTGNETKTVWPANLLAYRGLQLLSSMPMRRHLATTGVARLGRRSFFTWPVWVGDLDADTIRTLLSHGGLRQEHPMRDTLARMGVAEVYRCERIEVGKPPLHKINFSPAQTV